MDELRELVMRAQSGDSDAYDTIVRQYKPWGVRNANRMLKGFQLGERAEDVVQEAFFEAYCCFRISTG
jgi:DNA-directed RNA polymerase specialized sigma24 family protein